MSGNGFLEEAEQISETAELRRTIDRLSKQLHDAKNKNLRLEDAVYEAALDGIRGLDLSDIRVSKPPRDRRKKTPETAVFVPSDWQLAKVTPDYDTDVCEERIERYIDKALDLVEIQRADHPVNDADIWALGDIIEGELIFPGQSFLIDASLYRQVTIDGPRIMVNMIRRIAGAFPGKLRFYGVIGNHGRIGGRASRDMDPESNGDRMLYRIVQQICDNIPDLAGRIEWIIPDGPRERNWYAVAEIGEYRTLLVHGNQIRGHTGFPWYGLGKKVLGWGSGAIPGGFNDVFMGHWHQPTRVTLNNYTVRVSGSPESYNTYAQEELAAVGRPSQWLVFVHPENGVTAEYCVWLDV